MPTFRIRADQVPGLLEQHRKLFPRAISAGCVKAAHRARRHLVQVSPVDTGVFKNAWQVRKAQAGTDLGLGAVVENDHPVAGVIERGARPHPVSKEGVARIAAWVKRKVLGGMTRASYGEKVGRKIKSGTKAVSWADREAMSIAYAIAEKIKKHGQKGLFLVQDGMPLFAQWAAEEVAVAISKAMERPPSG